MRSPQDIEHFLTPLLTPQLSNRLDVLLLGRSYDSFNYDFLINLAASLEAAQFAKQHLPHTTRFADDEAMLRYTASQAKPGGLFLEFGVASGRSINIIAECCTETVYGFDSFNGLPEDWRPDFPKGTFAQEPPSTRKNTELVIGLFEDSLVKFLDLHPEPASFIHIDCDLYASATFVLTALKDRIVPGTIIVFDEFLNYNGWRDHEYKAWSEFCVKYNVKFSYLGCIPSHMQISVIVE